jgi:hypothetical protein
VKVQMVEAAYAAKNYPDARFALQQAMIGVQIHLGRLILKSLPSKINNLSVDKPTG